VVPFGSRLKNNWKECISNAIKLEITSNILYIKIPSLIYVQNILYAQKQIFICTTRDVFNGSELKFSRNCVEESNAVDVKNVNAKGDVVVP